MFDQVFESLRKATETNIQVQQEMFKKWTAFWPGVPAAHTPWYDQVQKFQKKWAEAVRELAKKQRETVEAQFNAGAKNIADAFRLTEVKNVEELRTKTIEFWQKSFDCLKQAFEGQVRDFQEAVAKWTDMVSKGSQEAART
jgi:hypothetical protein